MHRTFASTSSFATRSRLKLLLALAVVAAPSACGIDADDELAVDDELTAAATQAFTAAAPGLDFGGAFGYVGGGLVPNPATGAATCPAGYTATTVLGMANVDYPAYLCSRPAQGADPVLDFGGMWGYVNGAVAPNPATGGASCPDGYSDQAILDTTNIDYPVHVCYRPHTPGSTSALHFGGAWGYVNGAPTANPATGAASCPSQYASTAVLGAANVDYPINLCWQFAAGRYTAQAQVASVGVYFQVTVGVSPRPGASLSYVGQAGGAGVPGANGTWGDVYTDDLLRLANDAVSFQFNTTPFYTNVNFFDASSNFLGSYHGGGVGITTGIGGGTGTFASQLVP